MPTTDAYGQNINTASLTDAPDAATLAQNIVNALAPRSNMRFTSASQRDATITSGVRAAGMVAALSTEKLLTWWDGSAWTVIGSGASTWTNVPLVSGFSNSSGSNNANGTFQYRRVNLFGEPTVMLQGAVGVTYSGGVIPNGGVLTSTPLPTSSRPGSLRTVVIPCSDINSERITLKLDARPDGHLEVFGTNSSSKPVWIGFNGVFYSL